MKLIDSSTLQTIIANSDKRGARPASVRLACPVKLLKKSRADKSPCPFSVIVKHSRLSVLFAFDYAANVQRQREREGVEGEFKARENWFIHVSPAIVAHRETGELYAYARTLATLEDVTFTDGNGVTVERAALVAFLPSDDLTDDERASFGMDAKPANVHQGTEKEIQPFAVKFANVRALTIDGESYTLATVATVETVATPAQPVAA